MMYADIIVDISHEKLDRSFQYRVPLEMEDEIQVGMVVTIPFGNGNHERKGYVIGLSKEPELDPSKIKPLKGISSSQETTEEKLIVLAAWMKERYGSTMAQALKTVLPVREKVRSKEKRRILLNINEEEAIALAEKLEKSRCKARCRIDQAARINNDIRFFQKSASPQCDQIRRAAACPNKMNHFFTPLQSQL